MDFLAGVTRDSRESSLRETAFVLGRDDIIDRGSPSPTEVRGCDQDVFVRACPPLLSAGKLPVRQYHLPHKAGVYRSIDDGIAGRKVKGIVKKPRILTCSLEV